MGQAKQGDTVKVHYTGKLEDGTVFDSSREREPIAFKLGAGEILPGLEKAVEGLEPGEKARTVIPAAEAYGPHKEEALVTVERSKLPPDLEPQVGQHLQVQQPNGQKVPVRVARVDDAEVTLDCNHPLAGKDLAFEIELIAVQ